ncbi:MAG: hypothetical protein N3A67_01305 [Ignavibacteria bacterium]|nr:hypothetical protein [Ignavibacteria bacterium]
MNDLSNLEKIYPQRLDFYYQTIAIDAIVLVLYSILRGTIEGGFITIRLLDPISILLALFIVATTVSLIIHLIKRRFIVIGDDYIIFRVGKKERKYKFSDIERIIIKYEKSIRIRSKYKIALIKLPERKRYLRLRFSSYQNDDKLFEDIVHIKKCIEK